MSAEMGSSTKSATIYVPLLNEGTDVWRPTSGLLIRENVYRVMPIENYEQAGEEWEFPPGTIVECVREKKNGEEYLTAKKRLAR